MFLRRYLLCDLSQQSWSLLLLPSYVLSIGGGNISEWLNELGLQLAHRSAVCVAVLAPWILPSPELACMRGSIFSDMHSQRSDVSGRHHVRDSVRWSLMLLPPPEPCRRDVFVRGTGGEGWGVGRGGHVLTSLCAWVSALCRIMRKRLISIANRLISLAYTYPRQEHFNFFCCQTSLRHWWQLKVHKKKIDPRPWKGMKI